VADARWERVQVLFDAAVDRPPDDRPAFLDAECDGDVALPDEVLGLLAADAEASPFFDHVSEPAHDLDGRLRLELRVGAVGEVDRAHAPVPDLAVDRVRAQPLAAAVGPGRVAPPPRLLRRPTTIAPGPPTGRSPTCEAARDHASSPRSNDEPPSRPRRVTVDLVDHSPLGRLCV